MVDDISTLLFPHAAASAVILLMVLSLAMAAIMRWWTYGANWWGTAEWR